jgi:ureidoacrylate peracid hydrolase
MKQKMTIINSFTYILLTLVSIGNILAQGNPKNIVSIDAKPYAFTLDLSKTAVIVVDMQNDFGSKGGMFDLKGRDISSIRNTIKPISQVLAGARKNGVKVIYLKGALLPDLSDLGDSISPYTKALLKSGAGRIVTAPDGRQSRIQIRIPGILIL